MLTSILFFLGEHLHIICKELEDGKIIDKVCFVTWSLLSVSQAFIRINRQHWVRFAYTLFKSNDQALHKTSFEFAALSCPVKICDMNAKNVIILQLPMSIVKSHEMVKTSQKLFLSITGHCVEVETFKPLVKQIVNL